MVVIAESEERLEELRDEADGLEYRIENFCDGCEEVRFKTYQEEYWGAMFPVKEQVCEKGERRCVRRGEYDELCKCRDSILRDITVLELQDMTVEGVA